MMVIHACDLISRQAALAALGEEPLVWCDDDGEIAERAQWRRDVAAIKAVPPAQPETAKRIVAKSRGGVTLWYQCDMCNEPIDEKDTFCSGCGRKLVDECAMPASAAAADRGVARGENGG